MPAKPALEYQREGEMLSEYGQNILDNEADNQRQETDFFRTKTIEPQITTKTET